MRNLSSTQFETIQKMKEKGRLVRWDGGFWTFENAETKYVQRSSWGDTPIPEWHCDVRTLRALGRMGYVTLNEAEKICDLKTE